MCYIIFSEVSQNIQIETGLHFAKPIIGNIKDQLSFKNNFREEKTFLEESTY